MAYIEGDSLDHLITKGPVAITGAVSLVIALARAVHFAHSKGVIHRDLKPANIMLRDKRWPIITDFGIAKVAGRSAGLTQQGAVVGTPSYMAPEQADDRGHSVGPQSDVYSLGAVLYALLTGHPPFEDVTPLSTILKVISPDPPRSVRQLRPEVPEALEQICMKCLAKEAGQRYASAEALSDELKRCRALFSTGTLQKTQVGIDALTGQAAEVRLVAIETNKSVRLRGFVTVVGRGADCDLILRSADVSKRHCQLMWEDQHLLVEDLGSANGTYVNGKKVKRQKLSEGDRLDISGHSFEVHFKKQRPK
jgi:serine/threonine protein kinase